MLTADLVRPRRVGRELVLAPLAPKARARALELAAAVVDVFAAHVGRPRSELDEAVGAIPCAASERVLLLGMVKLATDLCSFGEDVGVEGGAGTTARGGDVPVRGGDVAGRGGDAAGRGDVGGRGGDVPGRAGDVHVRTGDVTPRGGDVPRTSGDAAGRADDAAGRTDDAAGRTDDAAGRTDVPARGGDAPGLAGDLHARTSDVTARGGDVPRTSGHVVGRADDAAGRTDAPARGGDVPGRAGDAHVRAGDVTARGGDAPRTSGDVVGRDVDDAGHADDAAGRPDVLARSGDVPGRTGDVHGRAVDVTARGGDVVGRADDAAARTDVPARGGDVPRAGGDVLTRDDDAAGRSDDAVGRRDDGAQGVDGRAAGVAPDVLRLALFERAAAARKLDAAFDRAAVLSAEARARGMSVDALEARLYADLPEAQTLSAAPPIDAEPLLARWEEARAQAVLLRAVRVTVDVTCARAGGYRALFRKLKFLQLLWTIERTDAGWRLVVDGPLAMFSSSTRYGLKLAMLLPALDACDAYALTADVRWGKERAPYLFKHAGGCGAGDEAAVPADVAQLAAALRAESDRFDVDTAPDLIELPGRGVVVPDLTLVDRKSGELVHVELLGHWSRAAVWKRVELVEQGLPARVVFCASDRLRVDEAGLAEDSPSCLYVYKGRPSAKRLLERVVALMPPPRKRARKK